jgi:hypothetical protein
MKSAICMPQTTISSNYPEPSKFKSEAGGCFSQESEKSRSYSHVVDIEKIISEKSAGIGMKYANL